MGLTALEKLTQGEHFGAKNKHVDHDFSEPVNKQKMTMQNLF